MTARLTFKRACACESGATAVEFSIVSLLLVLFFIAAFEIGRAFYILNGMGYAVDFGMRMILLDPALSAEKVQSEIRTRFHAGNPSLLTVVAPVDSSVRTVTAKYPISFIAPLAPSVVTLTISRTAAL